MIYNLHSNLSFIRSFRYDK